MASILTVNLWDKIERWFHGTLLYELILHIVHTFYTVRPVSYEKITLTVTGARTARNAILAVAVGVIIAAAGIFYTRKVPGGFVRALLRENAHSPENAKTLAELGYFYSVGVRLDLRRGGVLTRTVVRAGDPEPPIPLELREEEPKPEETPTEETPAEEAAEPVEEMPAEATAPVEPKKPFDFVHDKFYIPEVLRYRAELRYTEKGSGVLPLVLTVALTIVASGLLCRYLPNLLAFADWLIR